MCVIVDIVKFSVRRLFMAVYFVFSEGVSRVSALEQSFKFSDILRTEELTLCGCSVTRQAALGFYGKFFSSHIPVCSDFGVGVQGQP